MYRKINKLPSVQHIYLKQLIAEGSLGSEEAAQMTSDYKSCLEKVRRDKNRPPPSPVNSLQDRWKVTSSRMHRSRKREWITAG